MARHFFALRPDEAAADSLGALGRDLAVRLQGRIVPPANYHLTLAFLGQIDAASLAQAQSIQAPRAPAMEIVFDCVGRFREARVAWAGMLTPSVALLSLQSALARELSQCGLQIEERQFTPHVTLVRRIERPLQRAPIVPIAWRSEALVLMRSDGGAALYTEVRRWDLGEG